MAVLSQMKHLDPVKCQALRIDLTLNKSLVIEMPPINLKETEKIVQKLTGQMIRVLSMWAHLMLFKRAAAVIFHLMDLLSKKSNVTSYSSLITVSKSNIMKEVRPRHAQMN